MNDYVFVKMGPNNPLWEQVLKMFTGKVCRTT